eukprot:Sspe_Gene.62957::Locus_35686_Transcript_1_1_Confidence_1.000_Length_464::g.62957::m.62957
MGWEGRGGRQWGWPNTDLSADSNQQEGLAEPLEKARHAVLAGGTDGRAVWKDVCVHEAVNHMCSVQRDVYRETVIPCRSRSPPFFSYEVAAYQSGGGGGG